MKDSITEEEMIEFLKEIWATPEVKNERKIIFYVWEDGLELFHEMLLEETSNFLDNDNLAETA